MILCEWDAPRRTPWMMLRTPVCFCILSSSLASVSIFSVCCYSIVSISVVILYTDTSYNFSIIETECTENNFLVMFSQKDLAKPHSI